MRALGRHLGTGLLLGVVTGVVARGFMALFTAHPHFSWAGTGFIVGLFGFVGLVLAATYDLKTRHRSGWFRLLALPALIIGAGPGSLMLPGILAGALLASRRRLVRALGLAVLASYVVLLAVLPDEGDPPGTVRFLAGVAVLLGCCGAVGLGAHAALTGWSRATPVDTFRQVSHKVSTRIS